MLSAYLSLVWIQRTSLDGFGEDIDLSTVWEDIGCVPDMDLKRFGLI